MNADGLLTPVDWRSWGRIARARHRRAAPRRAAALSETVAGARAAAGDVLAVGLGRSYGDSCLNPGGAIIDMTGLDRLIAFDPGTGVLKAEAGASLKDILSFAVPRGFFLPTTPGTRYVTLGGAVANDVHGKNHHRAGTFGAAVRALGLIRSGGEMKEISAEAEPDLYRATIGGLGLTGVIAWVEFALVPIASPMIDQETIAFETLAEFFDLAEESVADWEHTVAWIDCLSPTGRGVFTRGDWAPADAAAAKRRGGLRAADRDPPAVPFDAPSFLLNKATLGAFNEAYFRLKKRRAGRRRVGYREFFYPLDALGRWNRLYGSRGFYQYQSVVPPAAARDATAEMLRAIAAAGEGSFLAVLKTFGDRPPAGMLSFPMPGATLALDFPNRGARTMRLLDRLDDIVRAAGGRLYPAKDGRLPPDVFWSGFPEADAFQAFVDEGLNSAFWTRMTAP